MRLSMASGPASDRDADMAEVKRLLTQAISESRAITTELFPPSLHELGLCPALRSLGERTAAEHGLAVTVNAEIDEAAITEDSKVLLFRIARELLNNAVKHASAQRVSIRIRPVRTDLVMTVEDDGVGFDPETADGTGQSGESGFGLFSVRQRLIHVGGTIDIGTRGGGGTIATVRIAASPANVLKQSEG